MSFARKLVLCKIAADAAFSRASQAVADAGFLAIRVEALDELTPAIKQRTVAIIYDLESSSLETAIDLVRQWRRRHPRRPVLLYHPPTLAAATLVGRLGHLQGVAARVQLPGLPGEEPQLTKLLSELVSRGPELLVRAVVVTLCPNAPAPVKLFLEALVNRLDAGGVGAAEVRRVAGQSGLEPWVVARACRAASLPTPERLIAWLTILYVIAEAEWEDVSIAQAGARAGVSDRYIRKLRASLLPDIRPTHRQSGARRASLRYRAARRGVWP